MPIQNLLGALPHAPRCQAWMRTIGQAVASYQYWNAFFLDPQQYRQAAHCYASMQHAARGAAHAQYRRDTYAQGNLDTLAALLLTLSTTELDALITRLEAPSLLSLLGVGPAMREADADRIILNLEAEARQARTRR